MSIALASILQSYEEALLIRSRIVGSVRVIVCGSATCLYHLSRIVLRGVVCVEYAPRIHWQSPCPVVIVVGCSWFVKTVPVVQYAFVASVKSVCQALLCIRLWLDGTHYRSLLLLAPCRTRCRAPLLLWLSNTVAFVLASAPPSPYRFSAYQNTRVITSV